MTSTARKTSKPPHPFTLNHRLQELKARFTQHRHSGITANPEGVEMIIDQIASIEELARSFMNELSAHRWNEAGRLDAQEDAVMTALRDPDGKVVLFAPPAPAFSDGDLSGGEPA